MANTIKVEYIGDGTSPARRDDEPLTGTHEVSQDVADYLLSRGDYREVKPKKKSEKKVEVE